MAVQQHDLEDAAAHQTDAPGPGKDFLFVVDNSQPSGASSRSYRVIVTEDTWEELTGRDIFSNELLDATFIGDGGEIRYNVGLRYRGSTCRRSEPKSYRVQLHDAERFHGITRLNLNRQNIDSQIQRYLAIKTVVSLFTGVFALIVLMFFGVDFALLFGLLTVILNYIPNIGSFIATVFPVFIAIFQFETIWPAVWILVILVIIQQIMGSVVEPRLMGEGLDLSPLVILFFLF